MIDAPLSIAAIAAAAAHETARRITVHEPLVDLAREFRAYLLAGRRSETEEQVPDLECLRLLDAQIAKVDAVLAQAGAA